MNIYVLYCQSYKLEKLFQIFNQKEDIEAFIPRMEKHVHSQNKTIITPMFPGYLFIKTKMNQIEFDTMLYLMHEEKDGIIRELKKTDVSALTQDEVNLLSLLLNNQGIMVMSKGYKENGKTVVTEGPLKNLQNKIIYINKRECLAILNIPFLKRNIKAGLIIKTN